MNTQAILPRQLRSSGHLLDSSETSFGELIPCADAGLATPQLERMMGEQGYLFLRELLDPAEVLRMRERIRTRWDGERLPIGGDGLAKDPDLTTLLFEGRMRSFFENLLGSEMRHFDYVWFRGIKKGAGTKPHCDLVYMGRGTRDLYTAWIPYQETPLELGGLMILEDSHKKADRLRNYLAMDVDTYCTNRREDRAIAAGEQTWARRMRGGWLTNNPASLREKLGGRWLTAHYHPGDVLVFRMDLIHASLENQTDQLRISTDTRYQRASDPIDERWVGENPPAHGPRGKRGMIC